jgi:hypothetical protein
MWATNSVQVRDWWLARSNVSFTPSNSTIGNTSIASATISGATDINTAVEIALPGLEGDGVDNLQVFLNGTPATPNEFRITRDGVKVRVGTLYSNVEVSYSTGGCTSDCTIWPSAAVPGEADYGPDSAIEVGVKFRADVDGSITGIRFYKAGTNTGTHIGNLWSASGQLLATATFVNETGSGWQQVNFSTPVAITANTVYIASYHTNVGHFAFDQYYFASDGVDSPPLHALQDGVSGPNGVYAYGASQFPTQVYHTTNYWVDVVFDPVASNTAPVASGVYITGIAGVGQTLTGHYTYTDADNDPEGNSTYRWLRDGVAIAGATGTSYLLTIDDLNAVISFEVMPEAQTGELQGTVVANAPDDGPGAVFLGGDITGDGKVDAADVLIVTRILLEGTQQSLTPEEMQIIDVAPLVNGVPDPDGQITAGDQLIITRMALTGTN